MSKDIDEKLKEIQSTLDDKMKKFENLYQLDHKTKISSAYEKEWVLPKAVMLATGINYTECDLLPMHMMDRDYYEHMNKQYANNLIVLETLRPIIDRIQENKSAKVRETIDQKYIKQIEDIYNENRGFVYLLATKRPINKNKFLQEARTIAREIMELVKRRADLLIKQLDQADCVD